MLFSILGILLVTVAIIVVVGYAALRWFRAPGGKVGRIEGVLLIDGKPAPPDTPVACSLSRECNSTPYWLSFISGTTRDGLCQCASSVMWSEYTMTEADGKFAFERIPEGEAQMGRAYGESLRKSRLFGWVSTVDESEIEADWDQRVTIRANETTHVTLGIPASILRGRFVPPHHAMPVLDGLHPLCAFLSTKFEQPKPPEGLPPEERDTWWKTFCASEEGLAWREADHRMYHVAVDGQGQFRVSNVHPGRYMLQVQLDRSPGGGPARPFGEYKGVIDVPDVDSDTTPATLDLGDLPLLIHTPLLPGDPMPSSQVRNHKGAPLEISFCKNDYLLLCLWWPLDDIYGAIPKTLNALIKGRSVRNNLPEVLVIVMGGQWAPAQHLLRRKKPDWPLKYVHEDDSLSLATAFGVRSSAFFLFAPDGKLVEGEIPPKMLKACLRRHSVTAV